MVMRPFSRRLVSFMVLPSLLALLPACGSMPTGGFSGAPGGIASKASMTSDYLVGLRPAASGRARTGDLRMLTLEGPLAELGIGRLGARTDAATVARLRRDPAVAFIEREGVVRASEAVRPAPILGFDIPTDPLFASQWHMSRIQVPEAHAITLGRPGVRVAIVDTGVDMKHPDLAGHVESVWDFIHQDDDARDDNGHGTHCAGVVVAQPDGVGVLGVAPGVTVLAVKVLDAEGLGTWSQVAEGIVAAVRRRADVINLSLGAPQASFTLSEAVKFAVGAGVTVVAAAGNENSDVPSYPASWPGVISVASSNTKDLRSPFSNYGPTITLAAPGSKIVSTLRYGEWGEMSGTSMASPHVAGVAALIKSVAPAYTSAQIRERLVATVDDLGVPGRDDQTGAGRVNAWKAIAGIRSLLRP